MRQTTPGNGHGYCSIKYILMFMVIFYIDAAGRSLLAKEGHQDGKAPNQSLEEVIVVASEAYHGHLLRPATETVFRFQLAETNDILTFRWADLPRSERDRLRKRLGMPIEGNAPGWGEPVPCIRLCLRSGKTVEGRELKELAPAGHRCLKAATQTVFIPVGEVESERPVMKRESDVYSPEEAYRRHLLERPPDPKSAHDHLRLARRCARMGLCTKAIEHLEMAQVIDPRIETRDKRFRLELVRKHADQQAEKLYYQILIVRNAEDYASAMDKIGLLKRSFPGTKYYTMVDGLFEDVSRGAATYLKRKVVLMYHTVFNDIINEQLASKVRLDRAGRPVPRVPGKQVTTKEGKIYRGRLGSISSSHIILHRDNTTYRINRKTVMSIQDADLSSCHHTRPKNFSELKRYIADVDGGIGKDILDRISMKLKTDRNRVRDAWAGRLERYVTVTEDGEERITPSPATLHKAYYGKGSWLREGVRQVKLPGQRGGRGPRKHFPIPPEWSDDPDLWWTSQPLNVRKQVLRALAAEQLFELIKPVNGLPCQECGGRGHVRSYGAVAGRNTVRCPVCRGLRMLTVISYR